MSKELKAYRTMALGIECIVFAENRGQAKHATVSCANEAGFDCDYSDLHSAKRAPEYDGRMGKLKPKICYGEAQIKRVNHE